jgi:hypothetical protein
MEVTLTMKIARLENFYSEAISIMSFKYLISNEIQ